MADAKNNPQEYVSPFSLRWSTKEMLAIWSEQKKWSTARRLWVALAEGQRRLGLNITAEQVEQMRKAQDDIDFDRAARYERELRHDVMAHIRTFGDQCPAAAPIVHLGATSCYVADNAEQVMIRDAMRLLRDRLANVIDRLAAFAQEHRALPTLAFTHYQPAQLTTVGKRACLWAQDFCMDMDDLVARMEGMRFRGVKGTTGTQASFLQLFGGDHEKVKQLDRSISRAMGFERAVPVTGQTYPRKMDWQVLSTLSGMAQSASKFASDIRLLQNLKEIEEPFGKSQVGSSAMAYKRNPMRSERVCGLARFVIACADNAAHTAATQWFERTLDDSANRRLSLAESFLAVDAILNLVLNVSSGLVVHEPVIAQHVARELPFMATEPILMAAVAEGGDRQALHERIREHSHAVSAAMHDLGEANDLIERIRADKAFAGIRDSLDDLARPDRFVGRAPEQVDEFIAEVVAPIRTAHAAALGAGADLRT